MTDLHLRRAGPADAALIADIHTRSRRSAYRGMLPDDYLDNQLAAENLAFWPARMRALEDGAGQALIAEADGVPLAFVCMLAPDRDSSVLIDNLHAAPDRKNSGAGTALLAAAAEWARGRGARRMHLVVIADNVAAIGFYESRGWRLAGSKDDEMGGAKIKALIYALQLT